MKKILFYISVALFFFSCHKNKNKPAPVTCDNYSIGTTTIGSNVTLVTTNVNTGQVIKNYQNVIQVDNNTYNEAAGVYDHIHNRYYLYSYNYTTNTNILYSLNTNTGVVDSTVVVDTLGYPALFDGVIVCNSTIGKLYFFAGNSNNSIITIYELASNDTGFSIRLVFDTVSSGSPIYLNSSSVVAENTGCIYFSIITGNLSNQSALVKVDPVSGISSVVTNTGEYPFDGLTYNNNDGMIYGVRPAKINPNSLSVPYISIDPVTGIINAIVDSISNGFYNATFDYCNNLYIYGNDCFEPSTGKLIKQINSQNFGNDVGIY